MFIGVLSIDHACMYCTLFSYVIFLFYVCGSEAPIKYSCMYSNYNTYTVLPVVGIFFRQKRDKMTVLQLVTASS